MAESVQWKDFPVSNTISGNTRICITEANGSLKSITFSSFSTIIGNTGPQSIDNIIIVSDPSAVGGGSGTWLSPYTPAEAAAAIPNITERNVVLLLKPGTHNVTYTFDRSKFDEVLVSGQSGKSVIVKPVQTVTSGWTLASGNVYWIPQPNSLANGLTDVTAGQSVQHWTGAYGVCPKVDWRQYENQGNNIAAGSITANKYSLNTSEQRIYCNFNGTNPNTRTIEITTGRAGIEYRLPTADMAETDSTYGSFTIENVQLFRCGIIAHRADCDFKNVNVTGAFGYGFHIQDCRGQAIGCRSMHNMYDGFNNVGQSPLTFPIPPLFTFVNCEGSGNWAGGDGFSNHRGQRAIYQGCIANGNGKNGFSPVDSAEFIDCRASFNLTAGFSLASFSDSDSNYRMVSPYTRGNFAGIQFTGGALPIKSLRAEIERPLADRNVRGIYIINSATKASCGTTNGSNVVTLADTSNLVVGMPVGGAGVPYGCKIGAITTNTSFTLVDDITDLAVNATATASVTLYFALGGTIIAPQYIGNSGFTIATQAQSALVVQSTLTTS